MDFTKVEEIENGIILRTVRNFNLKHIFECGQCFRWNLEEDGNYIGVAFERVIELQAIGEDVAIYNTSLAEFNEIWLNYFDLKRDYLSLKEEFIKDPLLKEAVEFGHGIRLLQQEPFELIVSFIISSNNRIPMIKKCILNISKKWGKKVEYKGKTYYTFPNVQDLHIAELEELSACSTGFRAKYIKDTVDKIYNNKSEEVYENSYDINWIKSQPDQDCHEALQKFTGVGPKVADCIMLFSMSKYSAFPVDVWVKRAMQYFYLAPDVSLKKIRGFAIDKFGNQAGFAQQYLFYYARENNISVDK
ncbi:MAG: DNA-3-methyladenine glycosylase 2 family protein [Clostridiaceae bacterium]|nr:DNA-3-methyladenine glycosylase 2 family protein [Clostridiaceae bacterium]